MSTSSSPPRAGTSREEPFRPARTPAAASAGIHTHVGQQPNTGRDTNTTAPPGRDPRTSAGPPEADQTSTEPTPPTTPGLAPTVAVTPPTRRRDARTTRARLLNAARRRFHDDGYERTNVRDIAADAGVNQALIFRYFGSKEELFRACRRYTERLTPDSVFSGPLPELHEHLLRTVAQIWETGDGGCHPLIGILRASASDSAAQDRLRRRLLNDLPRQFADLVAAAEAGEGGKRGGRDNNSERGGKRERGEQPSAPTCTQSTANGDAEPGSLDPQTASGRADAEQRGLLLIAWMMGIGMLRSVMDAPSLAGDLSTIAPHFQRVVDVLLPPTSSAPADVTGEGVAHRTDAG